MLDYIKRHLISYKFRSILLIIAATGIILALTTYDARDPSINVATEYPPHNLLNYVGSYVADLLYQIFGISAYVFPIAFFIWGCLLYRAGKLKWVYFRISLIIGAIIAWSSVFANISFLWLPTGGSGIIGLYLQSIVTKHIGTGSSVIAWLSFLGAILFFLGLGIHPNFYFKFFSKIAHLKLSNIKILSFKFRNKAIVPDSITTKISPVATSKKKSSFFNATAPKATPSSNKTADNTSVKNLEQIHNVENILPDIGLLNTPDRQTIKVESKEQLQKNAEELLKVLKDFGVRGQILDINQGPVVTLYEFEPAAGTKSSRVIGLADDIARSLSAISTRISVIPGRNVLGVELPNKQRAFFCLRELIETPEYYNTDILLPVILGKDLAGRPYIADLAKMPHLLVAGTTGSGKSVAINTMILSLLYRYSPEECKMIMIDPKMLELSIYDNIPHLLTPVVTEAQKAVVALKWAVKEMENRYRLMSNIGVRNIAGYNAKICEAQVNEQNLERNVHTGFDPETGNAIYDTIPIPLEKMPFIVVIVDEMADLMIVAGKDIEGSIQRLAQMARAAGIHIIMATQRPSVDVITGVIKANFPSRISFKVTSKIDSRTILGEQGSEQLLGMGDMLYMGNSAKITRVHGPFVADSEVQRVTEYLKSMGTPQYVTAVTQSSDDEEMPMEDTEDNGKDLENLYKKAVEIAKLERKISISYLQRCLVIGYNKAATIVEKMEKAGVISPPNHKGKREVLLPES